RGDGGGGEQQAVAGHRDLQVAEARPELVHHGGPGGGVRGAHDQRLPPVGEGALLDEHGHVADVRRRERAHSGQDRGVAADLQQAVAAGAGHQGGGEQLGRLAGRGQALRGQQRHQGRLGGALHGGDAGGDRAEVGNRGGGEAGQQATGGLDATGQ